MTITSSPPMRTSPTVTTVSSGLKVRLASLYGSEMRSTSCTPSSISISPVSGLPLPDGAEHRARDAGRAVHVHAHLDEARDDLFDLRFGRPFFHHYDHGFCRLQYLLHRSCSAVPAVARASSCTTRRSSAPRFVDDALEQPRDRVGPERPFGGDRRARARSTCFSRSG